MTQAFAGAMAQKVAGYLKRIVVLEQQNRAMRAALTRIAEGETDAAMIARAVLLVAASDSTDPALRGDSNGS